MKGRRLFIVLIVLILSLVLLRGFFFKSAPKQAPPSVKRTAEKAVVRVSTVEKGDIKLILSYVGSLKAKDEINVFSKASGKLSEYTVKEGDSVAKGQVIALLDRDETGLKYELVKVESPIAGIVGRTFLDKGASVLTTGNISQGTPLAVILNMDEMLVKLYISEPDIPYLKLGLDARINVDAYADEAFEGKISKISETLDPLTRTLPIEITIPNAPRRLKSGMFCRIKIIASERKGALYLSQDALVRELGANYVFVVEDNIARKRKVSLGIQEDSRAEIADGLKEDDAVIIFGQQSLKDGSPIEISKE